MIPPQSNPQGERERKKKQNILSAANCAWDVSRDVNIMVRPPKIIDCTVVLQIAWI